MVSLPARFRELPRDRPLLTLAIAILAVELVGASGSIFTVQGLGTWYETLQQPTLAPPNWVFGPVWTALFALIGVALWLVRRQVDSSPREARLGFGVFVLQFVFNPGWSAVFFGTREIGWGLVVIGILWLLVVATMWPFERVDRRAALLLVPYLRWISFATYLNYRFWVLNWPTIPGYAGATTSKGPRGLLHLENGCTGWFPNSRSGGAPARGPPCMRATRIAGFPIR